MPLRFDGGMWVANAFWGQPENQVAQLQVRVCGLQLLFGGNLALMFVFWGHNFLSLGGVYCPPSREKNTIMSSQVFMFSEPRRMLVPKKPGVGVVLIM